MSPNIDTLFKSAYEKLLAVTRSFFLIRVSVKLVDLLFYALVVLLSFIVIEYVLDLSTALRYSFWAIIAGLSLYLAMRHILPNLRKALRPDDAELYQVSRQIGKHEPQVEDSLINFLQIYRDQGVASQPILKNLSLKQLYQKFSDHDFRSILSWTPMRRPLNRVLFCCGGFLLAFLALPGPTTQAVLKLLYPNRSFEQPLPVTLTNSSGDQLVLKNEPLTLRGHYEGVAPHKLWLVVRRTEVVGDSATAERLEIPLNTGKQFQYEMNHVKHGFTYWFEGRVNASAFRNRIATSNSGSVSVKERPFIRELQVKLTYPRYTRLAPQLLPQNNGEITALRGTSVNINIEANKRLKRAYLQFETADENGESRSVEVELNPSENRASGQFVVEKDGQYQVIVEDSDGINNYQPVQYAVFALNDEKPFIEIAKPGEDVDIGDSFDLPLLINLRDDFGFSRLLLKGNHVRSGSSGDTVAFEREITFQRLDANRAIAEYSWDLRKFYMVAEDYIEYYAQVYDNDRITGPKTARSKTYIVRLPSLLDILEGTDETLAEQLQETEDLSGDTEELLKKLEEINREMKRENELTWERKKEIQEQLDRQKSTMEKLQEIQQEMQEMVEQLDNQKLLSPETLEKYFDLQKMMQEMATPELLEAMEKLQKAMENSDMEELKDAMEQFQLTMEEFEERIERTHELFKKVQMEQKMDELVSMMNKLAEEQQEINEQLASENLNQEQQEQLANQENNLQKNTDFFEEKLQEAQEMFSEEMAEIAQELQEAQQYMDQQQLQEQMQQMQQQMQQQQTQQAQQSGEQIQQQMQQMQSKMQQAQSQMQQQQKQELMQAMQRVQQNMLRTSFQQEQLMERANNADMASSQLNDIARQQAQIRENTQQMINDVLDISKETFFMPPQMSKVMDQISEQMAEALQSLADRNPRAAGRSQQNAMGGLNQAIMSMQGAMNQMSQSGSGTGFQEFMEAMAQMAGQQGQLNQQTMGMMQQQGQGQQGQQGEQGQQPGGRSTAQLQAQQEMIRRSLEQLNQQQGQRGDVLGNLGDLGEEMQRVIEDLKKQRIDPKVIQRQQKILSRMLDAQKSVREREYSKKRQAERDNPGLAKSPPRLKQDIINRENELRKAMLEALKEGYSQEYREFIKSYYEILSRQQTGGSE